MNISKSLLALTFAAVGTFAATTATSFADDHAAHHDGEDLNVHNKTGHEVLVFLFADDHVHTNEKGGVQFAHLKDGEAAIAKAPHCTFSVLLLDHEDIWHAEFHDCHSTDMTFTKDTGHGKKH